VRLLGLPDDERVQLAPLRRGRVQHRQRDRVGTQRQAADGVVLQVSGQLEQLRPDQRRRLGVQGDPAQVDVVVGFLARRQRHLPVHDGLGLHLVQQGIAI
jgi:hypothetical protein